MECRIKALLRRARLPFEDQTPFSTETGEVVAACGRKREGVTVVDFLVGHGIGLGKHIRDFAVVSVKTSSKERFAEDAGVLALGPARCYMVALHDPPSADRYERDQPVRTRIVTDNPNNTDRRRHKLTIAGMIAELTAFVAPSRP